MQITETKATINTLDKSFLGFLTLAWQACMRVYIVETGPYMHFAVEDPHKTALPGFMVPTSTFKSAFAAGLIKNKPAKINANTKKTEKPAGYGITELGRKVLMEAVYDADTQTWSMPLFSADPSTFFGAPIDGLEKPAPEA